MLFVRVLLMLLFRHFTIAEVCPPPEDITPCVCLRTNHNSLQAHCSGLMSLKQLQYSARGLSRHSFITFTIQGSHFEYLPSDIFENITIQALSFSKSNFSRIANLGEPQFQGLENSLQSLIFKETFSDKEPLAYVSLQNLKKLHTFEFRESYAGVVHNLWFKDGPASLKVVRFVEAHVQNVGYKALQSLTNLQIIDLSDNQINYVTRTMFPDPALHLEEINLERNKLESLSDDFFNGMPNLRRVNLELNEFSTLDENIWGQVWSHLNLVNIDYNPMICDRNIKWIYTEGARLENMLIATCYKPFTLMERDLHSLQIEELK